MYTMATNKDERRTIKIKLKTYLAIKNLGLMGETFDDVLQRIMGLHKKEAKKAKATAKDQEVGRKL